MLQLHSYDIVFQEVPGEISLALSFSNCPFRCKGCHSAHLREPIGDDCTCELLDRLLSKYGKNISCVCFMGGDAEPKEVERLAFYIRSKNISTAWYSGRNTLEEDFDINCLNYLKLGSYKEELGGLKSKNTNQRFYKVENGVLKDQTSLFWTSRFEV